MTEPRPEAEYAVGCSPFDYRIDSARFQRVSRRCGLRPAIDLFTMRRVDSTGTRRWLVVGTVGLLAFRLVLSFWRTAPLVVADEIAYLTNARVIAGGHPSLMDQFARGGYSVLIAPLVAIDGNPLSSYRLVLALNAVLAAALAPLLYLLLTRCLRISPHAAVWPALAAAAYPSVTVFSQVALSENLLFPLIVAWLLCFGLLLDAHTERARIVWAVGLGFCAAALWATHGSMIVTLALTAGALIALMLLRRLSIRAGLVGLGVTAAGWAAVRPLNDFLISRNYGGGAQNEAGQRLSTLDSLHGVAAFARNLIGQSWYISVASVGVLAAFAISGGLRDLPGIRRRGASTPDLVLGLLIATGAGLLVVSALSFRDLERPDMLIYGRYVEVVVPPLLAVALVRLASTRWQTRLGLVLAALGTATVAVVALRAGVHPPRAANRWNVISLPFLTLNLGPAELAGAGVVAAAVIGTLAAVAGRRPWALAPFVLVLFLPTTAVVEHEPVLSGQRSVYPHGWTSPGPAAANARVIAYDMDHYDVFGRFAYQWFMPHAKFVLFSSSAKDPPADYVITSRSWANRHPRLHPHVLWSDPGRDQVLLKLSSS
jgi:hypothetical protein